MKKESERTNYLFLDNVFICCFCFQPLDLDLLLLRLRYVRRLLLHQSADNKHRKRPFMVRDS